MAGPLYDVFRLIYERMRYYVRSGAESSDEFAADMGILIGDPASPIMWLLFFSDISIPDLPDDIALDGVTLSHLEQADDIVIFATSAASLQAKLNAFYKWCSRNFLQVNKLKSWWMPLGAAPPAIPLFFLGGVSVVLRESQTYVGLRLSAASRNLFAQHAGGKGESVLALSGLIFSLLDRRCLQCPPSVARTLYRAVIDPHLTHGCDISPDASVASVTALESAQNTYLRKLLRVGKRSSTVALFSETGIVPIRYRRADLLLRFLGYLLQCPDEMYVRSALRDSVDLARQGKGSWYSDAQKALRQLHEPVQLGFIEDSGEIDALRAAVADSARAFVAHGLQNSTKLVLLKQRPKEGAFDRASWGTAPAMASRSYLRLPIPSHRVAITRLLLSDHPLAVERLRWEKVPHDQRLCRFCHDAVEDETHALLLCNGSPELGALRATLWGVLHAAHPDLSRALLVLEPVEILQLLCVHDAALPTFARFVRDVLEIFSGTAIYRP
ncbi:hypothetical protein EXIGLDRAFT_136105 [Exidia glandulosa HHB12029]|uniref:Reverse transcriptase domain-containing protein n=1 Tax=Exidia glandulosa HHB12029 TaxID=1314781 RepID=A0A165NH70_EXIGL|nr:hypothetical protein EXIGLDRAFT_136105 [Exidia glandulosa HHB12029]